jgi:DNA-binding NarL/FixJ family response regulator
MVRLSPNLAPKDRAPTVRVLVVEDYAPFLQYIVSILARTDDLRVICEASDGLEAVHRAEELKPDLILLDIGLPTLNGIEAARQIRQLCPESKIIFVSQESDADIVQEALSFGALGYVVKTKAGVELLTAIKAVCGGRLFVGGLSSPCSC